VARATTVNQSGSSGEAWHTAVCDQAPVRGRETDTTRQEAVAPAPNIRVSQWGASSPALDHPCVRPLVEGCAARSPVAGLGGSITSCPGRQRHRQDDRPHSITKVAIRVPDRLLYGERPSSNPFFRMGVSVHAIERCLASLARRSVY